MKYTKFHVKNYKGIKHIKLDLSVKPETNIFTLVGLNESGKTSILEAINLLPNGIDETVSHTLIPKQHGHNFNETISISATLELDDYTREKVVSFLNTEKFMVTSCPDEITVTRTFPFVDSQPSKEWNQSTINLDFSGRFGRQKTIKSLFNADRQTWLTTWNYIKSQHVPKILFFENFLFDFPDKIYLHPDVKNKRQNEYREILQDLLNTIDPNMTLQTHLVERMAEKDSEHSQRALEQLLLRMSNKMNELVLQQWSRIFGGNYNQEIDLKHGEDVNTEGEPIYYLEFRVKQGSELHKINERSLGFRWFFSFLLFTSFRTNRESDPGETLFLLDEPASNLHQKAQQRLLEELRAIVSECKLIYSTHSHHLIDPKLLASTFVVRNKAVDYTKIDSSSVSNTDISAIPYRQFVANHSNEETRFKPILDALEFTPSKLEMVPKIIVTEGKSDYFLFRYFAEVIFDGKHALRFYPGAGVTKYESIFRLYLAWGREFLAIFDADQPGKSARRKYINDISPELCNYIFTFDEVDKALDNKALEDLLSETEKNKIILKVFPEYQKENSADKSKFSSSIQQLLIDRQQFSFNKSTMANVKKILDFCTKKLHPPNPATGPTPLPSSHDS